MYCCHDITRMMWVNYRTHLNLDKQTASFMISNKKAFMSAVLYCVHVRLHPSTKLLYHFSIECLMCDFLSQLLVCPPFLMFPEKHITQAEEKDRLILRQKNIQTDRSLNI